MKKIWMILLLTTATCVMYAQDLVITTYGDSLKCKITSETDEQFVVTVTGKKGNKINTFIAKQDVQNVQYNYDATQKALNQNHLEQSTIVSSGRLGFDIGGGCKLGKVAESGFQDLDNLMKGARFGFTFGLEGAYFFSETWGVGLRYSYFKSSNKEGNNKMTFNTNYIGPSIYAQAPLSNNPNIIFMSSLGLGYMKEKQSVTYRSTNADIKGQTLGMMFSLGFDFKISANSAISLELAYLAGALSKWEETTNNGATRTVEVPDGQKEGLSRIELKIGLKFLPK